jgi:diaminopimelate epimerase
VIVEAYRLSGAGNDFLALAEPTAPPSEATIRAWCRRGLSLGADGVLLVSRRAVAIAAIVGLSVEELTARLELLELLVHD